MNKEDKQQIKDFILKSRPVDKCNHIMQNEILIVLKEIKSELKKLNKDRD